ncbi:MAG: hypothetical protein CXR31_14095 [Geobacter sp.]|nr:MAG: hypothetical protein CXR31_14095 [Geobacter sp.]
MKKENLGIVLISAISVSFIIGTVLQISNLETTNYGIFESIFLALAIVSASSGVLLWGICLWDCLGNKEIKAPYWVFAALFFFNWVASIIYFFKVIYPRNKIKA